jgi:hypothetical protein
MPSGVLTLEMVERKVEEHAPGPSWRPTVLVVDS